MIEYYEGKNGQKFKRDDVQKKVYKKTADGEEITPSTDSVYKDTRVYGSSISKEEYLA